ncbi:hypothetical protein IT418_01105 [bacterium]|nr:hypothetical protein [bacterium]
MIGGILLQRVSTIFYGKVYAAVDASNPTPPTIPEMLALLLPVINGLLFRLGPVLLVVMIVYAGFTRSLAADNPKKVQQSTQMIFWAVIGYAVVLLSYLIVRLSLSLIGYDITKGNSITL